MKRFKSYRAITNTEVILPAVLMMCELLINSIIKENESVDMKQLTSYPLSINTEVNLLAVLIVSE